MTGREAKVVKAAVARMEMSLDLDWSDYCRQDLDGNFAEAQRLRQRHNATQRALADWYSMPPDSAYAEQMAALGERP